MLFLYRYSQLKIVICYVKCRAHSEQRSVKQRLLFTDVVDCIEKRIAKLVGVALKHMLNYLHSYTIPLRSFECEGIDELLAPIISTILDSTLSTTEQDQC